MPETESYRLWKQETYPFVHELSHFLNNSRVLDAFLGGDAKVEKAACGTTSAGSEAEVASSGTAWRSSSGSMGTHVGRWAEGRKGLSLSGDCEGLGSQWQWKLPLQIQSRGCSQRREKRREKEVHPMSGRWQGTGGEAAEKPGCLDMGAELERGKRLSVV